MSYFDIANLRHLRMVQFIGRLGGVSSAARKLNTSQPAVTQAISNLEEQIGTELFQRRATGTFPTRNGRLFLRRVDRFFEILEAAVNDVKIDNSAVSSRKAPLVERTITATQIRSLIATSDPASVEATARQHNVSPASLYRSARTLELQLGLPIFDRSANGPVCNETGERLVRSLRRAVRELDYARAEITLECGREEIEITIGALPMSGSSELAAAICAFRKNRPNAIVKIIASDYNSLLHDLQSCRIDMIYGLLRRPDWAHDVTEEAMFTDSYCVVARRGHPLTSLQTITPETLAQYDWIVPAVGTPRRCQIERLFDEADCRRPAFNVETSSLTYGRALLYKSDLITLLARSEVQCDDSLCVIETVPQEYLGALPPKGVATRTDWLSTPAHRDFLACLRSATAGVRHIRSAETKTGGTETDQPPSSSLPFWSAA